MGESIRYGHILRAVTRRPWAIDPDSVEWAALCEVLALRAVGGRLEADEILHRLEAAKARNGPRQGPRTTPANVAILPLYGTLAPRAGNMTTSGATALDEWGAQFDALVADPGTDAIVIDVDSPGGLTDGVPEAAAKVRAARGSKPIYSIANTQAASAAYWIGAQAEKMFAIPSGWVGSVGVFGAHSDISAAMEQAGERVTLIQSDVSPYKTEGNKYGPLDDEAIAEAQRLVNMLGSAFVSDLAKGRGVGVEAVRRDFGKGRSLPASDAVGRGMIDGLATLDEVAHMAGREAIMRRRESAGPAAYAPEFAAGSTYQISGTVGWNPAAEAPFGEQLAYAQTVVAELAERAERRADSRSAVGRSLSGPDRQAFAAMRDTLAALADEPVPGEPDETPEEAETPEPAPADEPTSATGRGVRLAHAQTMLAAMAGKGATE